jgi:hypothetical protein
MTVKSLLRPRYRHRRRHHLFEATEEDQGSASMNNDQLRQQLKAFWKKYPVALKQMREKIRDKNLRHLLVPPIVPPGFEALRCGATTRKGAPCLMSKVWPNGRCKFHGGLSTGRLSDEQPD